MISSHLYFAYADNMDEETVRRICPGVSFEGIAELKGYRLTFNSQGKITLIKDDSASAWGVVWCLSARDIHFLDNKERGNLGSFEKVIVDVNLSDGRETSAFLYNTTTGKNALFNFNLLEQVIELAHYWALPATYIEYLRGLQGSSP
jgi:hypothetical protein